MRDPYQTIHNIRLSEKAALATELNNEYVFEVDPKANKQEIAQAVRAVFGKKVAAVRTCNYDGKARRRRTASAGRTSSWKKAVVRLAPGEKIDLT
jgi:large subunit ribosomal protein L23